MKILKWLVPTTLIGTSIALPIAIFSSKNSGEPSVVSNFKLSTTKGKENLIEIFSDGYDFFDEQKLMPDPSYKDFKMFKYAYTAGHYTPAGKMSALGGLKDFNVYKMQQRNNDYLKNVYDNAFLSKEATDVMNKHLNVERSYFDQVAILNGYDNFSEGSNYIKWWGDTEVAKKKFPGIDYVNWSGARDTNSGQWGISEQHPDKAAFELVPKNITLGSKPGRIVLQSNITHDPFTGDANANGTKSSNPEQVTLANHRTIANFIDSLKNIKDLLGRSVYDNSMIIVWGDHASHSRDQSTIDDLAHSNVVLKFPDQVQTNIDIVEDKVFYMPQLNNLISTYFKTKPTNPYDAIFSLPAFSLQRTIGIADGTGMYKWNYDATTREFAKGDFLGDFDKSDPTQAEDIYKLIEDGGDYND